MKQRTQLGNTLRAHFAEFGYIVSQGHVGLKAIAQLVEDEDLPDSLVFVGQAYLDQIGRLSSRVSELERAMRKAATQGKITRRLQKVPGIGPITAMAIETFAPPMTDFRRGRNFAAWLGLVPRQHTSGGKPRLGHTSKMGQRDIRRLLIIGANAVILWAKKKGDGQSLAAQSDRAEATSGRCNRSGRQDRTGVLSQILVVDLSVLKGRQI